MTYRQAWEMYACGIKMLNSIGAGQFVDNWMKDYRLKAREIYRDEESRKDPYRVNVINRGDDYVEKLVADYNGETLEEVEEWFHENYYREYWNKGYDCTGQLFTYWHSIFLVDSKWIIYHCIAIDC